MEADTPSGTGGCIRATACNNAVCARKAFFNGVVVCRASKHGGEYVSSDDSDAGRIGVCGEVFTCDEGREADDEQSDWVTEGPGPVYGVPAFHCNSNSVSSFRPYLYFKPPPNFIF